MARFFGTDGTLAAARRYVSGAFNVSDEEVKSDTKLAELLRNIMRRLSDAEALLPPSQCERFLPVICVITLLDIL